MKSWIGEGNVWENYLFKEALWSQWIRECLWTSQMVMANNIVGHRQFLRQSYEGKVDNNNNKITGNSKSASLSVLLGWLPNFQCNDSKNSNFLFKKLNIYMCLCWIKQMCRVKEARGIHKENNNLIFFVKI